MKQRLADLPHEEFWTILLNRAGRVIDSIKISQGGTASATVESKLILRAAIQSLASAIILCHNHPSGTCKPSREDMSITRRIKDAAQLVEVSVVDHVIICDKKYYSFADNGDI